MNGLEERGRSIAAKAVRRVVGKLAARLAEESGVRVEADEDRVTITGRGLLRRLRWIGGLLK